MYADAPFRTESGGSVGSAVLKTDLKAVHRRMNKETGLMNRSWTKLRFGKRLSDHGLTVMNERTSRGGFSVPRTAGVDGFWGADFAARDMQTRSTRSSGTDQARPKKGRLVNERCFGSDKQALRK
jgi:hypothetical protein